MKKTVLILLLGILFSSCLALKEYEKVNINDADMSLNNRSILKHEINYQNYREGASGANQGKSGGGCGCN